MRGLAQNLNFWTKDTVLLELGLGLMEGFLVLQRFRTHYAYVIVVLV